MKRKADNPDFGPPGGGRGGRGRGPPRYGPGPGFGGPPPHRGPYEPELMHGPPPRGILPGGPPSPAAVGPLPDEPILLQEVILSKRLAGVLIGTGGSNVSIVRRESKCKVHVSEVRGPDQTQTVELTGTEKQISNAVGSIRRILTEFDPEHKVDIKPTVETTVEIYPEMVGSVLGKSGATIKVIRQKSGAHVRVEDLQPGERMQLVLINGDIEQVKAAYAEVKGIIDRFDPSKVKGGFAAPMMPHPRGMMPPPPGPGGRYGPPGPDDRYGPSGPDPRGRGPPMPEWYDDGYDYPPNLDGPYGPMGRMDAARPAGPRGAGGPYGPMRGSPPPGAGGRYGPTAPDIGPVGPRASGYGGGPEGPYRGPIGGPEPYAGGPVADPRMGPGGTGGPSQPQPAPAQPTYQPAATTYVQPATAQAQPQSQPQAVQPSAVPAGAQQQVGPVVLMLQPDGTYKPAQVVLYNVAGAQGGQLPAQAQAVQQAAQPTVQQVTMPTTTSTAGTQVSVAQPVTTATATSASQVVYGSTATGGMFDSGTLNQLSSSINAYAQHTAQHAQHDGHASAGVATGTTTTTNAAGQGTAAVAPTATAGAQVTYGVYGAQQAAQQQQPQAAQQQQPQTQTQAQQAQAAAPAAYSVYGQTIPSTSMYPGMVGTSGGYTMTQEQMQAYMRGQFATQQQQTVHQAYNPYAAYPYMYGQAQQTQQKPGQVETAPGTAGQGVAAQAGQQTSQQVVAAKADHAQQAQAGIQPSQGQGQHTQYTYQYSTGA